MDNPMLELTVVLREAPGDEQGFERVGHAIETLADPGAFVFSHGEERSPDVNEYVWFGPRDGDEISLVDDFMLEARYLAVRAGDHAVARRVRDTLADALPARSVAELRADASARGRAHALSILALVLDEVDAEAVTLVEQALRSDDAEVRRDAIVAASLTRSARLCDALRAALGRCADSRERAMLEAASAACCHENVQDGQRVP